MADVFLYFVYRFARKICMQIKNKAKPAKPKEKQQIMIGCRIVEAP